MLFNDSYILIIKNPPPRMFPGMTGQAGSSTENAIKATDPSASDTFQYVDVQKSRAETNAMPAHRKGVGVNASCRLGHDTRYCYHSTHS
jgi:hypothetical protein